MPLSDSNLRSLKPSKSRKRHADGNGLYIEVLPSGAKVFRLAYRMAGQQRVMRIGEFPEVGLKKARALAEKARHQIAAGEDPKGDGPQGVTGPLWQDLALEYQQMRKASGAAPRTLVKLTRQLEATFPALGPKPIEGVTAQDILDVVNPIAKRGHIENAHEVRTRCSQVFRYAAARGLVTHDPASFAIHAMVKRTRGHFAGITDPLKVGKLIRDVQGYDRGEPQVRAALVMSAYIFPRNGEIRGMRWDEIDLHRRVWEVPADRMKMRRDHLVPLPTQAVDILRDIKRWTGRFELVFPSPIDMGRPLSENTFNQALRRIGYGNDQHVHHGFRTTASTNLNEMGWNRDWIERQLAHVEGNKVRSAYNKALYLEGRTEMMQAYADWLDDLTSS